MRKDVLARMFGVGGCLIISGALLFAIMVGLDELPQAVEFVAAVIVCAIALGFVIQSERADAAHQKVTATEVIAAPATPTQPVRSGRRAIPSRPITVSNRGTVPAALNPR